MDYTSQPWWFKIRKVLRYLRLYGPGRTLIKIQGQYHKKKSYSRLPEVRPLRKDAPGHVGIIGCGNFSYSVIAYYLSKNHGSVVHAAMDRNIARAASLYERYGLAYYTDDARRLIEDDRIDLIYIASNHASHAEYAIQALDRGKCVHIEKPHVVSRDQLQRLCRSMQASTGRVNLGFNRPHSTVGRKIKQAMDSQQGAAMYNWFIAGHQIEPDHWYFKEEEGGRILGNLCHWTDFVYRMMAPENRYPLKINPTCARQSDCDIAVTYVFGDGSIAAITFSAKGHTFEGVRESLSAHRGNVLISMSDFKQLTIENLEQKHRSRALFRDHGHAAAVDSSYAMSPTAGSTNSGCDVSYVWETAELFLATKKALEQQRTIVLESYSPSRLAGRESAVGQGSE